MAEIKIFSNEQLREFSQLVQDAYVENQKTALPFETWQSKAFPIMANETPVQYPYTVRVAPSSKEMLNIIKQHSAELDAIEELPNAQKEGARLALFKEILQPEKVIEITEPILDPRTGAPIWFASAMKGVSLVAGFKDGNRQRPFSLTLDDDLPHGNMSGGTGSGKSVTMHTLITNALLMYPPWELKLTLADFKLVELSKYAIPVPAPHVNAVAGSENTVLVASILNAYADDMRDRSALFQMVGVSSMKDFRKRFNLVIPRHVLLIDELAQLIVNLKKAEEAGSATAQEEKSEIMRAFGEVARLGRSFAFHMLLSSQSLVGIFDEQTSKQFGGGIALKVNTPDDSVAVIGNDAAAFISGKGKCYINSNRAGKDPKQNSLVQIPFINCELSDKELLEGKQTYVTETLTMLSSLAEKFNVKTDLFYYNDNNLDSYSKFSSDLVLAKERFTNTPYPGNDSDSEVSRRIYREQVSFALTLGRAVEYSSSPQAYIDLARAPGSNILVSGDNKKYVIQMLLENFAYYGKNGIPSDHIVVNGDPQIFIGSKFEEYIDFKSGANRNLPEITMPLDAYRVVSNRDYGVTLTNQIMEFNSKNNRHIGGPLGWYSIDEALRLTMLPHTRELSKVGITYDSIKGILPTLEKLYVAGQRPSLIDVKEMIKNVNPELATKLGDSDTDYEYFTNVLRTQHGMFQTIQNISGVKKYLKASDFKPRIYWLLGVDTFTDVVSKDLEHYRAAVPLITAGPKVNVFTIITAKQWGRLSSVVEPFELVIEKEGKNFFGDIGMKNSINIYDNTFQIHNRGTNTKTLVKEFKLSQ